MCIPIVPVLTYLKNLTFSQGTFPKLLKTNKVIPIYKKGDSHLAETYRPVALISVFSKILEYSFLSRLTWLSSFLRDSQYVSVSYGSHSAERGYCASGMLKVGIGVPQGSVLGPFLFITYINDLIARMDPEWTVALFADDSSLIVSAKNEEMEGVCGAGLETLLSWFSNNSLFLNSSKTTYMRFHTEQNQQDLNMSIGVGSNLISRSATSKFLGLTLDENLNWKEQCRLLSSKLGSLCFMLRNPVLSAKQLVNVYSAYAASRLHYGICFWGASTPPGTFLYHKRG